MYRNETITQDRRCGTQAASTIALALALTVTLPLQAGSAADKANSGQRALDSYTLADLIDKDVYSSDGEKVGEITDVVLDFDAGEASRVLVDNEGAFEGSRLLDIGALRASSQEDRVEISMTAEAYGHSPLYRKGDSLGQSITPVWNQASAPHGPTQPVPSSLPSNESAGAMQDVDAIERDASLAFCHDVLGRDVEALRGEEIGEVEELIRSDNVVYAVIGDLEDDLQLPENADRIAIRIDALDMRDDDLQTELALSEIRSAEVAMAPSDGESYYDFGGERVVILAVAEDFAKVR